MSHSRPSALLPLPPVWAGLLLLAACAAPPDPQARMRDLLRREDARSIYPEGWIRDLRDPERELRLRAARGLGRTRVPTHHLVALRALEQEPDPAVRAELLFALGQLGAPGARSALLQALEREQDPACRARAAEALGKLGQDPAVLERLADRLVPGEDPQVLGAALLALERLHGARAVRGGAAALEPAAAGLLRERLVPLLADPRPDARWRAVYAFAGLDLPDPVAPLLEVLGPLGSGGEGAATLDGALRDRGVVARLFAARGLTRRARAGAMRDPAPLQGYLPAARDPHLAAALAELLGAVGSATPSPPADAPPGQDAAPVWPSPPEWLVAELVAAAGRSAGPADHHVRAAALAALLGLYLPAPAPPEGTPPGRELPERVERALRARLQDPSPTVRGEALAAMARLAPEDMRGEVESRAARPDPLDRVGAARAAALLAPLAAGPLLERLARDEDPRVACQALEGLSRRVSLARARAAAREALTHADLAVRATGMVSLGERGLAEDGGALLEGYLGAPGADLVEVRSEAVKAAAALLERARRARPAAASALQAGELLLQALLRRALADPAPAVVAAAAEAVQGLSGRAPALPPPPPVASTVDVVPGQDLLRGAAPPIRVVLETGKGPLTCELFAEAAPRHVRSFLDLTRRGFYDGLRVHRVVTGFVVQGLDPRGDGWGSGGVVLRDEINPVPYDTGTLGMPNAGPDTGGCQLFVTHIPTPHLDGRYTVFGRVVEGMQVLDALEVGDVVQRVRILDP